MMMMISKCKKHHIGQVTDIFLQAFSESIVFFVVPSAKLRCAFFDIFNLLFDTFQNSFFVALDKNKKVIGYIIVVKDIKRVWVKSLKSGFLIKILMNWILGRYGINLKVAFKVLINKIYYILFEGTTENCSQILSIAVTEKQQGR